LARGQILDRVTPAVHLFYDNLPLGRPDKLEVAAPVLEEASGARAICSAEAINRYPPPRWSSRE
jgi:hypothetical protein